MMTAVEAMAESSPVESARVQVQVVLYQSSRWLPRLLTGLRQLLPAAGGLTISFFDNSPDPEVRSAIAGSGLGASYHPSADGNIGFGPAHNALAARASDRCEYLLLLNPDAVPQYDCLLELMAAAEAEPRAALIEAAQFPIEHPKAYDAVSLETDWCSAACLLLRRSAFLELGGFDPALFLYCEDVDLSWRAWLSGWRCLYVPSARCLHVTEGQDLDKDRSAEGFHSHLGHLYLRRKYFGEPAVEEYEEALREQLAPRLVERILREFAKLPQARVERGGNPHLMLAPGEVYARRRW
jgi:N-acetylglucosaminyl-diphospho-decaprenol L-rhamnosyltransferase